MMFRRGLCAVGVSAVALLAGLGWAATELDAQEKPTLSWYGYLKLDAAWDEGLVNAGNYARWVVSEDVAEPHAHFNMTSRQTRLGFTLAGQAQGAKLSGRFESDFYGGGAENKNWLQVRHAYVEAIWPTGWSVLAGQASDVISPLNPGTLNYTVAWWAGNVGYRRPQVRVTKRTRFGEGGEFRIEGAAGRTIGDDFVAADPGDTGADSAIPSFQGLAGFTLPVSGRSLGFGVYGHAGKENLHRELGGDPVSLSSTSAGVYLTVPMGSTVTLSGEAWAGSNMDDYLGGIAQGIRVRDQSADEIASRGGWVELAYKSAHGTQLNVGASMDDPDADDLSNGARDRNQAFWGTAIHDAGGGLRYGIEVSRWETRYIQMGDAASWRIQTSVIFSF